MRHSRAADEGTPMTDPTVEGALARLRSAADDVAQGLLPATWQRMDGPGPDSLPTRPSSFHFTPMFSFEGLTLSPGATLTLETVLTVPPDVHGVPILDEPLLVTVNSLYPTQVAVDGRQVFADDLPVVASGP